MPHSNTLKPTTLVLSVGGSLVVPGGGIDAKFLKGFKKLIEAQVKKGWRFVIVVGGGGRSRVADPRSVPTALPTIHYSPITTLIRICVLCVICGFFSVSPW